MKQFEYKIFNMSEISKKLIEKPKDQEVNLVSVLNGHGADGWQVVFKIKDTSYLLMRELPIPKQASFVPA